MWVWLFWVSLMINVTFLFYVRWLLRTIQVINEDVENITDILNDFVNHIQTVYELEMFYGDKTLESLLHHGKSVVTSLENLDLLLNEEENIVETPTEKV